MSEIGEMPPSNELRPQGRSLALSISAVASFVMGGLFIAASCLVLLIFASTALRIGLDLRPRVRPSSARLSEDLELMLPILLIPSLIGGLMILAGIGLLKRRRWSRTLALGVSGFTGVLGVLGLVGILIELLEGRDLLGEDSTDLVIGGIGGLVYGGYTILICTTLLRKKVAEEFDRRVRRAAFDNPA